MAVSSLQDDLYEAIFIRSALLDACCACGVRIPTAVRAAPTATICERRADTAAAHEWLPDSSRIAENAAQRFELGRGLSSLCARAPLAVARPHRIWARSPLPLPRPGSARGPAGLFLVSFPGVLNPKIAAKEPGPGVGSSSTGTSRYTKERLRRATPIPPKAEHFGLVDAEFDHDASLLSTFDGEDSPGAGAPDPLTHAEKHSIPARQTTNLLQVLARAGAALHEAQSIGAVRLRGSLSVGRPGLGEATPASRLEAEAAQHETRGSVPGLGSNHGAGTAGADPDLHAAGSTRAASDAVPNDIEEAVERFLGRTEVTCDQARGVGGRLAGNDAVDEGAAGDVGIHGPIGVASLSALAPLEDFAAGCVGTDGIARMWVRTIVPASTRAALAQRDGSAFRGGRGTESARAAHHHAPEASGHASAIERHDHARENARESDPPAHDPDATLLEDPVASIRIDRTGVQAAGTASTRLGPSTDSTARDGADAGPDSDSIRGNQCSVPAVALQYRSRSAWRSACLEHSCVPSRMLGGELAACIGELQAAGRLAREHAGDIIMERGLDAVLLDVPALAGSGWSGGAMGPTVNAATDGWADAEIPGTHSESALSPTYAYKQKLMADVLAMRDPVWHPECRRAAQEQWKREEQELEEALQYLARSQAEVETWISQADDALD